MSVTPGSKASPLPSQPAADPDATDAEVIADAPADRIEQTAAEVTQGHHRAARKGIKLLMWRQVGLQVFTFLGGVVIARKLGPGAFGLFGTAYYIVNMLAQFGDFGLAPSFIQRKAELTERDLRVGFTVQQILITLIVAVIMTLAPWLVHFFSDAPPHTEMLVRALAFSLYLTSWRTMSALQLERNMRYENLAWIEILEVVIYQSIAVTLAIMGKGTWSYVIAVLAQGVVGTFLVYRACPWKIRLAFDARIARDILRYGIPFQVQMLLNSAGDWVIPLFVGAQRGLGATGLLTWSSATSKKPLILVDNVMRVAFPHFSRIQHDQPEVERTLSRYLAGMLLLGAVWFAVLLVAGPALVIGIYQQKWVGGITTLAIYSATLSFDITSMVLAVALNALGKPGFVTRIVLARSVCYMLFSVPLVIRIGYNGVPTALLIAQALTIPFIFGGLGPGSLQRVMGPIFWVLFPLAASIAGGYAIRFVISSLALSAPIQAVILVPLIVAGFAATAWPVSPLWLRIAVKARLKPLQRKMAA